MTPAARVAAAIEIVDQWLAGEALEKCLTHWARRNRYAGSKDRAAIRDHVFDVARCKSSYGWIGGAETGRGLLLGALKSRDMPLEDVFSGEKYAPSRLSDAELETPAISQAPRHVRLDCQDWVYPVLQQVYGDQTAPILSKLQNRAAVFLRVNRALASRDKAAQVLAKDEIQVRTSALSETALEVIENPRRVRGSSAFQSGLVELQDASSQTVVDRFVQHVKPGRVLDYCAGGGGKSLGLAAHGFHVTAHDVAPERMKDIPERAKRAGAAIAVATKINDVFDAVFCDVPCSGSGAWRRQPEQKWKLKRTTLDRLQKQQMDVLEKAAKYVAKNGVLGYATCSIFQEENQFQTKAFIAKFPEWNVIDEAQLTPLDGGDGFYVAIFKRHTN